MDEIINKFNSLSDELQGFITIVSVFVGMITLVKIIQGTVYVINNLPNALKVLKKFIYNLWLFISFPFRMIWRFIKWIFTSRKRKKYRKYLRESEFAIDYYACHPGFWKRFFSRKIRKDARLKLDAIEQSIATVEKMSSYAKTINFIDGTVGSGKTSFQSALSHVKTFIHINKISEKEENTKKILYQLDWNYIDELIDSTYEVNKFIPDIVKKISGDPQVTDYLIGNYDNYRQTTPKYSLLKDYIVARCARTRRSSSWTRPPAPWTPSRRTPSRTPWRP